jgi:uncharacterized LabA/DUF88 family protein
MVTLILPRRESLSHFDDRQISCLKPVSKKRVLVKKESRARARGRVALFIDGSNLWYAARSLNIDIDFDRFLDYVQAGSFLVGAYFYAAVKSPMEKRLLQANLHPPYELISKPLTIRSDGSMKGNLDVEIALDLHEHAAQGNYDTAVLVSGDGDFTRAIQSAKAYGRRVEVIGLRSMTSFQLIKASDQYINLSRISRYISRRD